MSPFLVLAGILAVFIGIVCGRTAKTMSDGPKQGTRFSGFVVSSLIGIVVGGLVALFVPGLIAGVAYGSIGCGVLFWIACLISERV